MSVLLSSNGRFEFKIIRWNSRLDQKEILLEFRAIVCAFVRGAFFHCSFLWPLSISKMPSQHTSLKGRCTAPKNFQNAISPLKQNKSFVHSEMLTHVFAVATQFFFVFFFRSASGSAWKKSSSKANDNRRIRDVVCSTTTPLRLDPTNSFGNVIIDVFYSVVVSQLPLK